MTGVTESVGADARGAVNPNRSHGGSRGALAEDGRGRVDRDHTDEDAGRHGQRHQLRHTVSRCALEKFLYSALGHGIQSHRRTSHPRQRIINN